MVRKPTNMPLVFQRIFDMPLDIHSNFSTMAEFERYMKDGFGVKHALNNDLIIVDAETNKKTYLNGTVDGNKYIGQVVTVAGENADNIGHSAKLYVLNHGFYKKDGIETYGWYYVDSKSIAETITVKLKDGIGGLMYNYEFPTNTPVEDVFNLLFNQCKLPECFIGIGNENIVKVERGTSLLPKFEIEYKGNDGGKLINYKILNENDEDITNNFNELSRADEENSSLIEIEAKKAYDIDLGEHIFKVICNYESGVDIDSILKNDLKLKSPIQESFCESEIKIIGCYPAWAYTTSSIGFEDYGEIIARQGNFKILDKPVDSRIVLNVNPGDLSIVFAYPKEWGVCKYINFVELEDFNNESVFNKDVVSVPDAKITVEVKLLDDDGNPLISDDGVEYTYNELSNPEPYYVYKYTGNKEFDSKATFVIKF